MSFGGSWPGGIGRYYHLIITITAADDGNPVNDTYVSAPIPVPNSFTESEPNDDGPPPPPASSFNTVGVLDAGQLMEISGTMDTAGNYDTFVFTAGAGVTRVEIHCTWAPNFDDIDLEFWNQTIGGSALLSQDTTSYSEPDPANAPWTIVGLTPGDDYAVGVWFYLDGGGSGSTGQPYTLQIRTLP